MVQEKEVRPVNALDVVLIGLALYVFLFLLPRRVYRVMNNSSAGVEGRDKAKR